MSRAIKFRIWDAEVGRMSDVYSFDDLTGCVRFFDGSRVDALPINFVGVRQERFTFRQYTGLKDKNGIEIYEGDILHACVMNGSIVNAQVTFNGGCYLVSALQGENWAEELFRHCRNEVIGNIYENPELLEAK